MQELLKEEDKRKGKYKKRKYISRTDSEKYKAHHWTFNISINGERINKTFSDKKNGDKSSALLACLAYRNKILKKYNVVFMEGLRKPPTHEDAKGVCFYIKKSMVKGKWYEYATFKAYWHEPAPNGKQKRKTRLFYISKHGFEVARKKALAHRKKMIKQWYGK